MPKNTEKEKQKAVSRKISLLRREGIKQKQAIAIALSKTRKI